MARFFGKLFLINFAIGVVTGIVQEFQFGMTGPVTRCSSVTSLGRPWPSKVCCLLYGVDVLGIWIFGRGRVSKRVHLASIWLASVAPCSPPCSFSRRTRDATPVGFKIDKATGQP